MMPHIAVAGAFPVAAELTRHGVGTVVRARSVVRKHGTLLQARVRAHASGRPGPRIRSGDYNRSIVLDIGGITGGDNYAEVGTNEPQGRRLEHGFFDTDSLGRVYRQPPYRHFSPALTETAPGFIEDVADLGDLNR
jgi:hypothetical protein